MLCSNTDGVDRIDCPIDFNIEGLGDIFCNTDNGNIIGVSL